MAFNSRVFIVIFLQNIIWNLAGIALSLSNDELSDIRCLRSIKESLEDPHNRLTWTFDDSEKGLFCEFVGVHCSNDQEFGILGIGLVNMGLKGRFPRGIGNCKSLQILDLSGNNLFGQIPFETFGNLVYLSILRLSSNRFSGKIPSTIANCKLLETLRLDNNQLTGQIPWQFGMLERLHEFNVSKNLLSGPVPAFSYVNFTQMSYANNRGLCGRPLKPCIQHRLKFDYSFKSGFLVGYVISAVFVATIFVSYCVSWVSVKKGKKMITLTEMIRLLIVQKNKRDGALDQLNQLRPIVRRQKKEKETDDQLSKSPSVNLLHDERIKKELITVMSLAEIRNATNNFSEDNVIGLGQIGTMYKATLSSGQFLAVKKLHATRSLGEQFMLEFKTLVKLRQCDNMVQLLGFCVESKERFLAYEYLSNGNLYDWLHPAESESSNNMEWPLRVKIATGVARGLACLHNNFGTVHLDISSECILLDQNFNPKLSNFKQAKHLNPSGTSSTMSFSVNREFWQSDFVKEDVHSFGLVLLEMITGKEPSKTSPNSFDGTLIEWIAQISGSTSMFNDDTIDKSLIGRGFDSEIIDLLEVASHCVQPFPDQRPTMFQVYKTLRTVGERHGLVDISEARMPDEIASASTRDECYEV